MNSHDADPLENRLNYHFKNRELLKEALRHSSFVNEQADKSIRDNERLEFLGDAVLNLVIGHILMRADPMMNEGDLSRIRANLVNETTLADIARDLEIGTFLELGKGEEMTDGRNKSSILADTFEAVTAAIYLDSDFETTFEVIERQMADLLENPGTAESVSDFKSRLQEFVQMTHHEVPKYHVVDASGPDHDKTFHVQMSVCGIVSSGEGKSKKLAEQDAARNGLILLKSNIE